MRIAIDCRAALSPKTGDRTYILNLLRGLCALDLDPDIWQFDLLLDAPDERQVLPQCKYLQQVVLPAPNSRAWTLLELPRFVKTTRPDLVHLQYLAPRLNRPFVTTVHDVVWRALPHTFPRLHRAIMDAFMPGTLRRARRVICGTNSAQNDLCKYLRVPKTKICVTDYSIDPHFFAPVDANQRAKVRQRYYLDGPYVLSVGVQQPRKNIENLVRAFAQWKAKFPDMPHKLVICGKKGWGDTPRDTGAASHLVLAGYVADADLPALYSEAQLFAYPSLYEGFGLPILEAMACGCAVLTSDRGAMSEVAANAAQRVEPESIEAIARGLENVLNDAPWRENLVRLGRERAAEFSVERHAQQTLEVYREACNSNS